MEIRDSALKHGVTPHDVRHAIRNTSKADPTSAERMLGNLDPTTDPMRDGRHLRRVGAALTRLEQAEEELRTAVSEAHAAGDSWAAISLVLGTSRQAAHRKFAPSR